MLNEIPEFFHPEIRQLIDFALEDAWHELRNDGLADTASVRGRGLPPQSWLLQPLVKPIRLS